jgi:hypothetical protein
MDVRRPEWWKYPERCHRGHEWGPGRVIVGFMPCDCPAAVAVVERGHLYVRCRAGRDCPSIWYRPAHDPASSTWQPGQPGGAAVRP